MQLILKVLVLIFLILLQSCNTKKQNKISDKIFGSEVDGKQVKLYTLVNESGIKVCITNYGAIVQSLIIPDKNGLFEDVVLGYDTLEEYRKSSPYFGAIVGRYGNRIAGGKFSIDGVEYALATNNGANHLHGGNNGFDKVVWNAEPIPGDVEQSLKLTYLSPDGEEGYPGNLKATVIYTLTNKDELKIDYSATTDKATPLNLTHHGYFNLSGNVKRDILGHELWVNAERFIPVDDGLIPTGELRPVVDTPFDFRTPQKIGSRINEKNEQLKFGLGYDHNWCLNDVDGTMKLQASLYEPESGRLVQIFTLEPGLQFYSGNFLDGSLIGKDGKAYAYRTGLCLETQHFPDSPNHPDFPSTILRPGEEYKTSTIYTFSVK